MQTALNISENEDILAFILLISSLSFFLSFFLSFLHGCTGKPTSAIQMCGVSYYGMWDVSYTS